MKTDTDTKDYPVIDIGQRPRISKILPNYQGACIYGSDPLIPSYRDMVMAGKALAEIGDTVKKISDCIYFIYNNPTISIDDCMRQCFPGVPTFVRESGRLKKFYKNGYLTVTEELK